MADTPFFAPDATAASTASASLHEALRPPTRRLSFGFILMLCLANIALWFSMQPVIIYLLPEQIIKLDPNTAHQGLYDGLILAFGAFFSIFSNTIGGALSDRTTSRWGRRAPWMIGSAVLSVGALALLANANTIALLFIGYGLYQLVVNGALAALTAVVPDKAPDNQRGLVSAFVGLALPVAIVLGAVVIGFVVVKGITIAGFTISAISLGYYILAASFLIVTLLFIPVLRDTPLPRSAVAPFSLGAFLRGFWINPRTNPDFGLAWLVRFLVNFGWSSTLGSFLLLYLTNAVKVSNPAGSAAIAQIIAVGMILISSIIGGYLSDKFLRRKIFVMSAAALIAVALFILAFVTTWTTTLVAAVIVGLGFGTYLAVDLALMTEVLPSQSDRGKDMGVFNIANALPNALAPLIGGVVIAQFGSFQPLFFIAAGSVLLAALLVLPIKKVR
ncbi:MAG TPA: MFS transporter [Ktedonobacterales bacterium]